MKYIFTILLLHAITFYTFSFYENSNTIDNRSNVLVLNSYHKGYLWSDNVIVGIEDALNGNICDLHIEYMDTKRQYDDKYQDLLADLLSYKHKKHGFDVIITSDNNAFDFAKKYRDKIFDSVPIIFCGVNYFQEVDLEHNINITGVSEIGDFKQNIHLIEQIHPGVKNIVVVTDNTTTGMRVQQEVLSVRENKLSETPLTLIFDVSVKELTTKLQGLGEGTVVLYTVFFRDNNNVFLEYDKSAELVSGNASVPVYGMWNFSLGHGIVGGYLTNGYDQGHLAGVKTLKYLSGIEMKDIPIYNDATTTLAFDYRVLIEKGIKIEVLPKGATILYEPQSFLQRNKKIIRSLLFLIVFLTFSILVLSYILRKTHRIKLQLSVSEKRLRTIMDALPSMIFIKNNKGKFLAVNKTMARSLGKSVSEVEGQLQRDLHPKKDEVDVMLNDDKVVFETKQELRVSERSYHDAYGKQHWLQTIKVPCPAYIFDEEAVIGVSMDVTQLKNAKRELKFAYDFADNILETANVIMITINNKGNIKTINRYGEEIVGYKRSEIINTNWVDRFIPASNKDQLNSVFSSIMQDDDKVQNYENLILCKDGSTRLISWNNSLIKDSNGKINGFLSIGIDITDQRKATVELKKSESKFKSIFDYSPFGIIYYDTEGVLLDCNESFANLVGSPSDKLIGLNLTKMPDKNLAKGISDSILTGVGVYNEYYRSILVEKLTPIKAVFRAITDADGKIVGGIGMTEDITKQKQAEEAMIQANKELQKALEEAQKSKALEIANELLTKQKEELNDTITKLKNAQSQLIQAEKMASVGILTSGIAHEINNPLNFIQGGKTALELYIYDYLEDKKDDFAPFIEMIETGINRAVEIIQSLNRFNRKTDTYDEVCNLNEIIDNGLIMTQNQMKHRVEVIKDFSDDDISFNGNEGKIHQVVLNIITNAEQAIENEGSLRIRTFKKSGKVVAEFSDTGCGIKPEDMVKIRDPFFTTKDPGKGTGLGLSIAYNIMQEHNGTINFDSEYKNGTTVTLVFPMNG